MTIDNLVDFPANNRFIDILDYHADGSSSDKHILKYYEDNQLHEITYNGFRNKVNYIANQLKSKLTDHLELNSRGFYNVGFLANSGHDFLLNLLSLMKLNLTPVILSPRNSLSILIHLIQESNCQYLFYCKQNEAQALECAKQIEGLALIPLITHVDHHIVYEPVLPIINLNLTDYYEHIIAIIHSSGSTSTPKLNYLSNKYFKSIVYNERLINDVSYFLGNGLIVAPFFHLYGLSLFVRAFFNTSNYALPRNNQNVELLVEDIKNLNIDFLIMLPYLLKQLKEHCDSNSWNDISNLKVIQSGGALIPKEIGDVYLKNGIKLQSSFGSTEIGCLGYSNLKTNEYNQIEVNSNINFKLTDIENDTCQITILKQEPILSSWVVKDDVGYPIGDIFKLHEYNSNTNYLRVEIVGRANDTIIHITGEKTNPVPIEQAIMNDSLIDKCLVYGNNQLNNCAIIKLNYDKAVKLPFNKIVKHVFNLVNKTNLNNPQHSRIDEDLVLILPLEYHKQFELTAKGNIIRKKSEVIFQDEIKQLYQEYENNIDEGIIMDSNNLSSQLINLFKKCTSKLINADDKFFNNGMDSLSVVKYKNQLLNLGYNIRINDIYDNDTINKLSHFLNDPEPEFDENELLIQQQQQVNDIITNYTKDLHNYPVLEKQSRTRTTKHALVTGANGSLGSFLIHQLALRNDIQQVYALIRAKDSNEAQSRLQQSFDNKRLVLTDQQWNKIISLPYNLEDNKLGLNDEQYNLILNEVDIIYHIAWKMDFLKGVLEFQDCISSTVNLLKLCSSSNYKPSFNFISSVGATFPINQSSIIKEDKLNLELKNLSACNGYNLSKLICEQLNSTWSTYHNFNLDIYRVGQISGDIKHGIWNIREHIPLIIKGVQVMKIIPSSLSEGISWIPVDYAAKALVDIYFNPNNQHRNTISHIVNPEVFKWQAVIEGLKYSKIQFEVVNNLTFINTLKSSDEFMDVDKNPLASLTDFLDDVLKDSTHSFNMDTQKTKLLSPAIEQCPKIDNQLINKYVQYWIEIGFLDKV